MTPTAVEFSSSWESLVNLPKKRWHYALVAIGSDRVAIVGGRDASTYSYLDTVDVFNLKTKQWTASYQMQEKREGCAAVAIGERIYIFGGCDESSYLSSCEMFDLGETNPQSKPLPSMTEPRIYFSAVVYDKTKIVVLGGLTTGCGDLATVEMFDTTNKTWTELPSMSVPRYRHVAGVAGSQILVAGGETSAELFDMETNTWKAIPNMNEAHVFAGAVVIGKSSRSYHMVVAGQQSCEVYGCASNQWSELPGFSTSNDNHRKVVVLGGKLIAGGNTTLETLDFSIIGEAFPFLLQLTDPGDLVEKLKCWATEMSQLQELPFLYTIVRLLHSSGAMTEQEHRDVLTHGLTSCIPLCISPEHLALFLMAVEKAKKDNIIDSGVCKSLTAKATATHFQPNASLVNEWTKFLDNFEAASNEKGQTVVDAVKDLQACMIAAHESKVELRSACASLIMPSQEQWGQMKFSVASISESFDQYSNKLVSAGSLVFKAIFRVFLNASRSGLFEKMPYGTVLTRIIDFGDPSGIINMIDSIRARHSQECDQLKATFEEGLGAPFDHLDDNLLQAQNDGNAMHMFGVLCRLISKEETSRMLPSRGNTDSVLPVSAPSGNTANKEKDGPLDAGADLAAVTVKGCSGLKFTPTIEDEDCALDLFAAIYHGNFDLLTEVFEYEPNVDVNQVDSLGRTPADFAAIMGQPEMMDFLIQKGGQNKLIN